jgi:hypothetical protein
MIYIASLFILCSGYYTLTYGISLWKDENNKLGGFGVSLLAVIGTVVPIIVLFMIV